MHTSWRKSIAVFLQSSAIATLASCNLALGIDEFSVDGCPAVGELRCRDTELQICQANGQWFGMQTCATTCADQKCNDCVPGAKVCNSTASVNECTEHGYWRELTCDNQTCVDGACVGECAPGTRCVDEATIETCVDGTWMVTNSCPAQSPCVDGACYECSNGDRRCDDNRVLSCVGSKWTLKNDCSANGQWGQTCIQGACVGQCSFGVRKCVGSIAYGCDALGQWYEWDCASIGQSCDLLTGMCFGECTIGTSATCVGNAVRACKGDSQWQSENARWTYEDCGPNGTCIDGVCTTNCGPASGRCQGNQAEACSETGEWKTVSTCTDGCTEGTCIRSTCECGSNQTADCCSSPYVPGGTFDRANNPATTATIGAFRLDKDEITVGRFRRFVAAYDPALFKEGMGENPHVPGSGWKAAWNGFLPATQSEWNTRLACSPTLGHWTDAPGPNESRPMNCLTWYEAFAFCIWDGGFLPTEAEWNFAAAAGDEQREYPWSVPAANKTINVEHAVFDYALMSNVGSRSPKGDGKFGHRDLAGSMFEWTFDVFASILPAGDECIDCANLADVPGAKRVVRGGAWSSPASMLYSHARAQGAPAERQWFIGARCARSL